jgi:hypothetical protein
LHFGLRRAHKPITILKPCRTISKRTCKPNSNFTNGSDPDGSEPNELSEESPKLSDQVLRTPETSTKDLSKVSLMVRVALVNLEGTSNGSGPLRSDGVVGATSLTVFIKTPPESQDSVFPPTVMARLSDRGIHKPVVSTFRRGLLNSQQPVVMGKAPSTASSPSVHSNGSGLVPKGTNPGKTVDMTSSHP